MKQAVFFDLDNTLIDRNRSIDVYAERLINYYSEVLINVGVQEIAAVIREQDNGGYLAINSPYKSIKEAVSHELHRRFFAYSSIKAEELKDHWINWFPDCAIPMCGADDLLSYLSGSGYHIGVISNGADKSRKITARKLESFSHIKQVMSSESAGVSKPAIDIFINSAFNAGFTPEQCWFIGDHPGNDIAGASSAGMRTIWLMGFHDWPKALKRPTHSIEALVEVQSLLSGFKNLNRGDAENASLR